MNAALDLLGDHDHTYIFVPDTAADLPDGQIAGYMECRCGATRELDDDDVAAVYAQIEADNQMYRAEERADELRFALIDIVRSQNIYR